MNNYGSIYLPKILIYFFLFYWKRSGIVFIDKIEFHVQINLLNYYYYNKFNITWDGLIS